MPSARKFDVLGLGAVAVDDFLYVESFPPPDTKRQVLEAHRQCGGLTATALVTAARLGGKCAYAGVLGEDELSTFAMEAMRREGIDVSRVPRKRDARPVHSRIVVDRKRGTRNIFFSIEGVIGAGLSTPRDLISSSRVLFVDNLGVPGMLRAARIARQSGVPVVADFESDSHPDFEKLLGLVDHLILSREFGQALTKKRAPDQIVKQLSGPGREVVAITDGVQGCWYWTPEGNIQHQPAFKVKAVDTTGCGDVFHGAYAFALALDLPVADRFCVASATAALKAKKPGGQAGIPTYETLRTFLDHEHDCVSS